MTFDADPETLVRIVQEITARAARPKSRLSRLVQMGSTERYADELELLRVVQLLVAEVKAQRDSTEATAIQSAEIVRQVGERLDLLVTQLNEFGDKFGALYSGIRAASAEAHDASEAAGKARLDLATVIPQLEQKIGDLYAQLRRVEHTWAEESARQRKAHLTLNASLQAIRSEHTQSVERLAEAIRADTKQTRDSTSQFGSRLEEMAETTAAAVSLLKESVATERNRVTHVDSELRALGEYARALRAQVTALASELARDREAKNGAECSGGADVNETLRLFGNRLAAVETAAGVAGNAMAEIASRSIAAVQDRVDSDRQHSLMQRFYLAFENAYRGTRDDIQNRQRIYLETLSTLEVIKTVKHEEALVIDLGCGRGEWLGLLRDAGFQSAVGVDENPEMVSECRKQSLNVECCDVLDYLHRQPSRSAAAITGFHIAEHMPFPVLLDIVVEARRVLMKSGILILETPNPENILVATRSFYLDPTHRAPIPPQLLAFVLEHCGLSQVRILRLHAYSDEHRLKEKSDAADRLNDFFYCSQDYSAIGLNE